MPVWEYGLNRLLCSGLFWSFYKNWGRVLRAAFPFKLLIGQMAWKFVAGKLDALVKVIRDEIVEMECQILEDVVPVTVGVDLREEDVEDDGYEVIDEHEEEDFTHDYDDKY